jgi:hypothetical protein
MTSPTPRAGPAYTGSGFHRYHLDLLLFGLVCLILSAVFIWLHVSTPSDGVRLSRGPQLFTRQGVIVSPYESGQGPLREGDQVTAVEGISMETGLRAQLAGPRAPKLAGGPNRSIYSPAGW